MLNAVNVSLAAFSYRLQTARQILASLVIAVAAPKQRRVGAGDRT